MTCLGENSDLVSKEYQMYSLLEGFVIEIIYITRVMHLYARLTLIVMNRTLIHQDTHQDSFQNICVAKLCRNSCEMSSNLFMPHRRKCIDNNRAMQIALTGAKIIYTHISHLIQILCTENKFPANDHVWHFICTRHEVYISTRWGRVTHVCVSNLTIIGSNNCLSPSRCQAIILTNAGVLTQCSQLKSLFMIPDYSI